MSKSNFKRRRTRKSYTTKEKYELVVAVDGYADDHGCNKEVACKWFDIHINSYRRWRKLLF